MNTPTLKAIGIDLGTTNCCVAYFQPSRPKGNVIIIPNEMGNKTTPSVVAFNENNEVIIGELAKEHAYNDPRNTIFSAKRLIGRKFSDETVQKEMRLWPFRVVDDGNDIAKIQVKINGSDKTFFPEQISAKILENLKQTAENYLGCEVKNAVITVPAYFNDSQKEATKDTGAIAGLNVLKIVNEPTAAAIAFKLNRSDDRKRTVLIYDFGGRTFDVAVLEIDQENIKIKSVGGDNHLGGDDFDTNIVKYCLDQFYLSTGVNVPSNTNEGGKALRRLRTHCEKQKCMLSSAESITIFIDNFFSKEDLRVDLTRVKFEELNEDLFAKSMDLVQQTLEDAEMSNSNIDDVVLVGGSTRIPRIQEMLSGLFEGKTLNQDINPDEAVAVGAAIQAAILIGDQAQCLTEANNLTAVASVKDSYISAMKEVCVGDRPFMNPKSLETKYQQLRLEALEDFDKIQKMGGKESSESYREKLVIESDQAFEHFEAQNKSNKSTPTTSFSSHPLASSVRRMDKELKLLITNARKFYKEEMNKYYQKTNFLKAENLHQCNRSVVERTIAKYESHKNNMSIHNFKELVKESLKDIYQEIIEQNNMNTPTLVAIGIDLGTTNSRVAYFQPSRPKGNVIIIPNEMGNKTTPSVVAFNENNEVIIGESAKECAYITPRNTIFSVNLLIGRKFSDETVQNDMSLWPFRVVDDGNDIAKIQVKINGSDKIFFPEEISAKILKKLKQTAENYLGCEVKNAVITVPAYFNDVQKEATKDAGTIAGLNVLKIINEPTAATIAFQLNRFDEKEFKNVLIYDFGRETFGVAVLEINRGNIDIKAVGGDNHLGGDDFDTKIFKYCLEQFYLTTGINVPYDTNEGQKALRRLRTRCEEQKCKLSSADSTIISVDGFYGAEHISVILTRDKFEELNEDLFIRSMDIVQQTLEDKNMKTSDIDDIVLVGGSTRIPRIQEMLTDMFNKPLNHSINPDEAVAVGAAIQAAILNGKIAQIWGHLKVSDVVPMSLGIKVCGGFMSIIIPRNSKVPNKYTKQYETSDYQTSFDVDIYEGEEEMAQDNRLLGRIILSGIPSAPKGEQLINVTFEINDEGILHVNAKILSTGGEEEIEIKEHKGRLTDKELQDLIRQV